MPSVAFRGCKKKFSKIFRRKQKILKKFVTLTLKEFMDECLEEYLKKHFLNKKKYHEMLLVVLWPGRNARNFCRNLKKAEFPAEISDKGTGKILKEIYRNVPEMFQKFLLGFLLEFLKQSLQRLVQNSASDFFKSQKRNFSQIP